MLSISYCSQTIASSNAICSTRMSWINCIGPSRIVIVPTLHCLRASDQLHSPQSSPLEKSGAVDPDFGPVTSENDFHTIDRATQWLCHCPGGAPRRRPLGS